jgi:hypothetical protein
MAELDAQVVTARTERLIVEQVGDETVVYDLDTDMAHCLNPTSGAVWQACQGGASVQLIAAELGRASAISAEAVWAAIAQLRDAKLLDGPVVMPADLDGLSRRALLKRLAVGGAVVAAVPVVTSILAPTPAAAVSAGSSCSPAGSGTGKAVGCPCSANGECSSGKCNTGPNICKA